MTKRKLVKTKTSISRKTIRASARQRLLLAVVFMVFSVPASWFAVQAQPADTVSERSTAPEAGHQSATTLGATDRQTGDKRMTDTDKRSDNKAASQPATGAAASPSAAPQPSKPATPSQPSASSPAAQPVSPGLHQGIIATVFWAGELPGPDNGGISNVPSAWDEKWAEHYGGYDDPDHRNSFYPAGFMPKENPFYFALPYNDYGENGQRKASATACSAVTGISAAGTSWCKNAWIKIIKGSKTAYAQWQDVGPYYEDDYDYVFGTAAPRNTSGARAGLDVSPAVRDYLGMSGVDKVDWSFVAAGSVPAGPWKQIITTSGVYWQ